MPQSEVVFYKEGESVMIREWLRRLPAKAQRKCLTYIAQLEMQGHDLRRPVADFLRDGIYELRPSYQGVNYRILYFSRERIWRWCLTESRRKELFPVSRSTGQSSGRKDLKLVPAPTRTNRGGGTPSDTRPD